MKKTILFIAFNVFILQAFAQLDFYNNLIIDESASVDNAAVVLWIDVDGDSDLDVVSGSYDQKRIGWQENLDGLGTYGDLKIITDNAYQVRALIAADIDGDGIMDLVSGSTGDGKVAWYKNDGLGNFSTQNIIINGVTGGVLEVVASDVDGDGDLDIVASLECCSVAWFKNLNGLGAFGPRQNIASVANPTSISLADMDGDGDMDIVTNANLENQYIRILWMKNLNGLGTFGAPQIIYTFTPEMNYSAVSHVAIADMDGDGDNDILFTANNQSGWIKNTDGAGTFNGATPTIVYENDLRRRFSGILSVDMDGDGDLDIITYGTEDDAPGRVTWFENTNGEGVFSSGNIMISRYNNYEQIQVADVDADGDLDVLVAVPSVASLENVVWFRNDGNNANFEGPQFVSRFYYQPLEAKAIDLDGDGDLDIIHITSYKYLVWYENLDGVGTMSDQRVIATDAFVKLQFADINGDGFVDIIATSFTGVVWFQNDGNADFSAPVNVTADNYAPNAYVGDIDGDGYVDVVTANFNIISYYRNTDGLGNFGESQFITNVTGFLVKDIIIRDFDADGDNDIAYVSESESNSSGQIGWVKNTGSGAFDSKITLKNEAANAIEAADLDGDGHLDIISGRTSESVISLFKNDGVGSFYGQNIINSRPLEYNGIRDIAAVDIDNDGDLDIVVGSRYGVNIEWFDNLNGIADSFASRTIALNVDGVNSVFPADFDADGKIDVIYSASEGNHPVGWFKNSGLLTNRLNGQVILDVNNDGCSEFFDTKLANLRIETTNGSDTLSTFTNNNGFYQMFPSQEGTYVTTIQTDITNFTAVPNFIETEFTGFGNLETADFCFTANQLINDLRITIIPLTGDRPGSISRYAIRYQNIGTVALNGSVVFDFDGSKMSFISGVPNDAVVIANQLSFDFTDLVPFEYRTYTASFQLAIPPTVNLGEILSFTGTINPIPGDATEDDNIYQLDQVVRGAYDPNDITVLEGPEILIDDVEEFLHYVIRFQNTGNASAINVQVENTLDPNLDWSTIEVEYVLHDHYVEILNGNKVKFIFPNINLPDSTSNFVASQGYIAYKIKPKSNSAVGDIFYNSAEIYFDYNPAIFTNEVETLVIEPLSIPENERTHFAVYPNPTTGIVNIKSLIPISSVEVYNYLGQKVISVQNKTSIDMSDLSRGMYFITIKDQLGNEVIKKVIRK